MRTKRTPDIQGMVDKAIKQGILKRLDYCEVCGKTAREIVQENVNLQAQAGWSQNSYTSDTPLSRIIHGHHWRGYDHPLDVWWVCVACNRALHDKHDGSLATPADAHRYIKRLWGSPLFAIPR